MRLSEKAACCLIERVTLSISSKLLIKRAIPAILRYGSPLGEGSLLPDREVHLSISSKLLIKRLYRRSSGTVASQEKAACCLI